MTLTCSSAEPGDTGKYVAVIGTVEATLADGLRQSSVPNFPGVPAEQLSGKSFTVPIIDVHLMEGGRIKRTWHVEDWAAAVSQMVGGKSVPLVENPPLGPGEALTQVPQAVRNFYEQILQDIGSAKLQI